MISSWIYRTLGKADSEYASKLHEYGYDFRGRKYKLFTFGSLKPKWYQVDRKRAAFTLVESPTILELSFYMDEAIQHFVTGLFQGQHFELSSGRFRGAFEVVGVEILPKPEFLDKMRFRLASPLCVSKNKEGYKHPQYLPPDDEEYEILLLQNLVRKQNALLVGVPVNSTPTGLDLDFQHSFKRLSPARSKLFSIKGTKIKGYIFDFELKAPASLLELGYFGGFGEKNSSLGMGMVGDFIINY